MLKKLGLSVGVAITTLSFLLPTTAVAAESEYDDRNSSSASFGVQGGINTMSADVTGTSSDDMGFLVGLTYDAPILGPLSIQPELNLNRVGANSDSLSVAGVTRFTYLEVPLLLKALIRLGGVGVHAVAGPKIAFLLDTDGPAVDFDREDFEVGLYLGAGLSFAISDTSDLSLTGRYAFGLTDIDASDKEWKFSGFQLLAGLSF